MWAALPQSLLYAYSKVIEKMVEIGLTCAFESFIEQKKYCFSDLLEQYSQTLV